MLPSMICAPGLAQLIGRERLDRGLRADRHEYGRFDVPCDVVSCPVRAA